MYPGESERMRRLRDGQRYFDQQAKNRELEERLKKQEARSNKQSAPAPPKPEPKPEPKKPEPKKQSPEIQKAKERVNKYKADAMSDDTSNKIYGQTNSGFLDKYQMNLNQ